MDVLSDPRVRRCSVAEWRAGDPTRNIWQAAFHWKKKEGYWRAIRNNQCRERAQQQDHTAFHIEGLSRDLDAFVALLADIVLDSNFPAEKLERERQLILHEFSEFEEDPAAVQHTAHRVARSVVARIVASAAPGAQAQTAINQAMALAGTDFGYLSDAPGFPVAILIPGSYKLTGNLRVPPGASGIEIWTRGITIDMNGLETRTMATCTRDENSGGVQSPNAIGKTGVDFKAGGNTLRNGRVNGRVNGFMHGVHYKGVDHLENVENNVHAFRLTRFPAQEL